MNYFIAVNLKPVGPFSKQEVLEQIQKAVIGPFDMIMCGDNSWKPASEYSEFPAEIFPANCVIDDLKSESTWVLLVKQEDQLIQQGPFSTDHIQNMIQTRKIGWDTRAWRQGLAAWIKISDRPEFRETFISLGL